MKNCGNCKYFKLQKIKGDGCCSKLQLVQKHVMDFACIYWKERNGDDHAK